MARRLGSDLVWGISIGLGIAIGYSLFAGVLFALATMLGGELDIHYLPTAAGYVTAGVIGGGVVGLLRPFAKYLWGAMLTGGFVATVAIFAVFSGFEGGVTWIREDGPGSLVFLAATAFGAGCWAGWNYYRDEKAGRQ